MAGQWSEGSEGELRFEPTPFQPDGGFSVLGLLGLLIFGAPLAVVTGVGMCVAFYPILWLADQMPYWLLFFVVSLGLFLLINVPLMLVVYGFLWLGKFRNAGLVTVVVVLLTAIAAVLPVLMEVADKVNGGMADFNESYVFFYISFVGAVVATGAIMITAARKLAWTPFCTVCNSWKKVHFKRKLNMPIKVLQPAIETGDVVPLAEHKLRGEGPLTLTVMACPNCKLEATAEVKLEVTFPTAQNQSKTETLAYMSYPGPAAVVLEEIFAR